MKLYSLKLTSPMCPAQWEAEDHYGNQFYIRYRFGVLTMQMLSGGELMPPFRMVRLGGELDGWISEEDMLAAIDATVEPEAYGKPATK